MKFLPRDIVVGPKWSEELDASLSSLELFSDDDSDDDSSFMEEEEEPQVMRRTKRRSHCPTASRNRMNHEEGEAAAHKKLKETLASLNLYVTRPAAPRAAATSRIVKDARSDKNAISSSNQRFPKINLLGASPLSKFDSNSTSDLSLCASRSGQTQRRHLSQQKNANWTSTASSTATSSGPTNMRNVLLRHSRISRSPNSSNGLANAIYVSPSSLPCSANSSRDQLPGMTRHAASMNALGSVCRWGDGSSTTNLNQIGGRNSLAEYSNHQSSLRNATWSPKKPALVADPQARATPVRRPRRRESVELDAAWIAQVMQDSCSRKQQMNQTTCDALFPEQQPPRQLSSLATVMDTSVTSRSDANSLDEPNADDLISMSAISTRTVLPPIKAKSARRHFKTVGTSNDGISLENVGIATLHSESCLGSGSLSFPSCDTSKSDHNNNTNSLVSLMNNMPSSQTPTPAVFKKLDETEEESEGESSDLKLSKQEHRRSSDTSMKRPMRRASIIAA